MSNTHHICVCICTYRRPVQLHHLLWKLENLETENSFDYSIVIMDNDASESARPLVESRARESPLAISYHVEPQQNIALARNRAVASAKGDYLAFIDDDEWPDSAWLLNLFLAIRHFKTAGILGPVIPRFGIKPPSWVLKGRFFERPIHSTGDGLEWKNTRTGNVLLRRDLFTNDPDWFNPRFGSGGEDRDFFRRKIEEGHVFVWCEEAPVFESVPPERWGIKVLMKRALLRGKMAFRSSGSSPKSILTSAGALAIYSVCLPFLFVFSPLFGYDVFVKYLIRNCDHLGKILALLKIDIVKTKYVS
jgi:succinoglycan biosynthesis protein ExoM